MTLAAPPEGLADYQALITATRKWQAGGCTGGTEARFDENNLLHWARQLEEWECVMVYGRRSDERHSRNCDGGYAEVVRITICHIGTVAITPRRLGIQTLDCLAARKSWG